MISVPSTVPSSPPADIASSRQIIRKDAAINRIRNQKGAKPVASIHFTSQFTRIDEKGRARCPHRAASFPQRGEDTALYLLISAIF
jgi:hypothetical protein